MASATSDKTRGAMHFSSTAVPSVQDTRVWASLSASERRRLIVQDLDEAECSGISEDSRKDTILTEALNGPGREG